MPATMATPLPLAPLHLAPVGDKAVDLDFDGGRLSSDAGIVLHVEGALESKGNAGLGQLRLSLAVPDTAAVAIFTIVIEAVSLLPRPTGGKT